jgi:hypothetical protein
MRTDNFAEYSQKLIQAIDRNDIVIRAQFAAVIEDGIPCLIQQSWKGRILLFP